MSSSLKSLVDNKKERVELLRLKAGLLEVIPAICSKCEKSIELSYVERQVESFGKEQLEAMMKSTEKIGLFCCNCLNERNGISAPQPRNRVSTLSTWTARDVRVTIGGVDVSSSIVSINLSTYSEPGYELGANRITLPQIRSQVTLDVLMNERVFDLCGREIEVIISNNNLGRYRVERVDQKISSDRMPILATIIAYNEI